jgi:hypothetical protein
VRSSVRPISPRRKPANLDESAIWLFLVYLRLPLPATDLKSAKSAPAIFAGFCPTFCPTVGLRYTESVSFAAKKPLYRWNAACYHTDMFNRLNSRCIANGD